jgi:hypothetical protein
VQSPTTRRLAVAELHELFVLADTLAMRLARNHPLDGMSIPEHDHLHLYPSLFSVFPMMEQLELIDYRETGELPVEFTPFSTYLLYDADREKLARQSTALMDALDEQRVVFSFCYSDHRAYFSPRLCVPPQEGPKLGMLTIPHLFNPQDLRTVTLLESCVPPQGAFSWEGFTRS